MLMFEMRDNAFSTFISVAIAMDRFLHVWQPIYNIIQYLSPYDLFSYIFSNLL